ncbi:PASTA domain-containing protein [Microbacterium sp. MMO-56]|uniref:PASTA domain-containing protein n=1 Tax=unclassified Microbacterium TaxID=2609290 RepID=UPI003FA5BD3E
MGIAVPDLVGQPVHIAQDVAARVGLGVASGDPDGPGLLSRTWPGIFWVTGQQPPAGSEIERGEQTSSPSCQTVMPAMDARRVDGTPPPYDAERASYSGQE